ncbi:hypothetical protein BDV39DRAFT_184351 [Aspergillus sergii]|uniref:Uncharacterized protein n=1 Tax=Aspergillus sergii TaxID=1034303 RepID=A0A5N6WNF5_9EURO|nr:hypothetical protein BDV39DRAFT_184351 [Aspergillus sergii]
METPSSIRSTYPHTYITSAALSNPLSKWPAIGLAQVLIQILCLSFPPLRAVSSFSEQILCCLGLDVVITLPLAELPVIFFFFFCPLLSTPTMVGGVSGVAMYPTCEKGMYAVDGYETCTPPCTFSRQRGLDLRHY